MQTIEVTCGCTRVMREYGDRKFRCGCGRTASVSVYGANEYRATRCCYVDSKNVPCHYAVTHGVQLCRSHLDLVLRAYRTRHVEQALPSGKLLGFDRERLSEADKKAHELRPAKLRREVIEGGSMVYYLSMSPGLVKIGKTVNLVKRVSALYSRPERLLEVQRGYRQARLYQFEAKHSRYPSEMFDLARAAVNELSALGQAA